MPIDKVWRKMTLHRFPKMGTFLYHWHVFWEVNTSITYHPYNEQVTEISRGQDLFHNILNASISSNILCSSLLAGKCFVCVQSAARRPEDYFEGPLNGNTTFSITFGF